MRCSAVGRDVMTAIHFIDNSFDDWYITANDYVDYRDNDGIWVVGVVGTEMLR
jgi:hypothetical protein